MKTTNTKKSIQNVIILTFLTMIISLVSFIMLVPTRVYATAPAGYYDFLATGNTKTFGSDLSMSIYLNYVDYVNDEDIVLATINGGSYNNTPFIYTEGEWDGQQTIFTTYMFNGSTYDVLGIYEFGYQSYNQYISGSLTLGNWAFGKTITAEETAVEPLLFVRNFSTGGPEGTVPVLTGWEGVYITNVNSPITLANLKNLVYAYDEEDGDVSDDIIVTTDNYTANRFTLGLYEVSFSVSDSNNNTATLTLYVKVVDVTAPVINGSGLFTSNMSNPLTVNDIKSTLTVTDNYDSLTSSNITVKTDNFTANKTVKGSYTVVFEVSDSSGNKGQKTVTVNVVDDIKPVITGQASYTKGQSAILSLDTIKSGLSATDNVDGNISSSITLIEDKYSNKGSTVGTWTLKYRVTDSSGNQSDVFTVSVTVTDTMPPVFFVDSRIISVDSSLSLTQQQIIDILTETGQINLSIGYSASFVIDEYQGTQVPGQYNLSVKVDYANGSTQVINLTLNVVEQDFVTYPTSKWFQSWSGWKTNWFGIKFIWDGILDVYHWCKDKITGLLSWLGIK